MLHIVSFFFVPLIGCRRGELLLVVSATVCYLSYYVVFFFLMMMMCMLIKVMGTFKENKQLLCTFMLKWKKVAYGERCVMHHFDFWMLLYASV